MMDLTRSKRGREERADGCSPTSFQEKTRNVESKEPALSAGGGTWAEPVDMISQKKTPGVSPAKWDRSMYPDVLQRRHAVLVDDCWHHSTVIRGRRAESPPTVIKYHIIMIENDHIHSCYSTSKNDSRLVHQPPSCCPPYQSQAVGFELRVHSLLEALAMPRFQT